MASPFAATPVGTGRSSGFSPGSPQKPAETGGLGTSDAVFLGESSKKKTTDFWDELAAAADDPSLRFLREESDVSQLADADKPWWPLTLAMLALFASMGGNLYMGWIAVDVYRRYLEMTGDGDGGESYESPRHREDEERWEDRPRRRELSAVED
jgi:hypothetical protein